MVFAGGFQCWLGSDRSKKESQHWFMGNTPDEAFQHAREWICAESGTEELDNSLAIKRGPGGSMPLDLIIQLYRSEINSGERLFIAGDVRGFRF